MALIEQRHDARIGDSQALDTPHREISVEDRHRIVVMTHLTRPGRMVACFLSAKPLPVDIQISMV